MAVRSRAHRLRLGSPWLRGVQVACALVWCLLAGAPIFGFDALKRVWRDQGVYSELCVAEQPGIGPTTCYLQQQQFNRLFGWATAATGIVVLPTAWLIDRYGPRVCIYLASISMFAGVALLGHAPSIGLLDGYLVGYVLLALAGPPLFISTVELAKLFPRYSGTILALLTGALHASSGVFLVYKWSYEALITNAPRDSLAILPPNPKIVPRDSFWALYLLVPLFIALSQLLLMPHRRASSMRMLDLAQLVDESKPFLQAAPPRLWESPSSESISPSPTYTDNPETPEVDFTGAFRDAPSDEENAPLLSNIANSRSPRRSFDVSEPDSLTNTLKDNTEVSGVWGALHRDRVSRQVQSPWFILMVLFASITTFRINYFIVTAQNQYSVMLDSAREASQLADYLDFALPLGGLAMMPITGFIVERVSVLRAFIGIYVISLAIGALGMMPTALGGWLQITLLAVYRPLLYTAIADYTINVFGFKAFGRIFGMILAAAGLVNLAIPSLYAFGVHKIRADPNPPNLLLLISTAAFGLLLILYISRQGKRIRRKQLEEEAENAPVQLMPEAIHNDCQSGNCEDCVCQE